MIVVACGSRKYHDGVFIDTTLDSIHAATPITLLINGGQTGADRLAECWAISRGVKKHREIADWRRYGDKLAGVIRNQKILDDFRPDMVVAFPGGRGTNDMIRRAKAISYADACIEIAPRTFVIRLGLRSQAMEKAS